MKTVGYDIGAAQFRMASCILFSSLNVSPPLLTSTYKNVARKATTLNLERRPFKVGEEWVGDWVT